jgi:hypothetical protein
LRAGLNRRLISPEVTGRSLSGVRGKTDVPPKHSFENTPEPVGATVRRFDLLAMAVDQSTTLLMTDRYREQARSHSFDLFWTLLLH